MKRALNRLLTPLRRQPQLFHALRSVWTPSQSMYQHLYFEGKFSVGVSPGKSFEIWHYGYALENDIFWRGYAGHEATSTAIWRELSRTSQYIADIGANTGVFALAAATENPNADILAFEPVAGIYKKLVRNIELNGLRIHAVQVAVSDGDGEAVLYDPGLDHSYSASLEQEMLKLDTDRGYSVPTVRMDTFLDTVGFPRLDLAKIDVERHEPQVLRGMVDLLREHRPSLLVEVLDAGTGDLVEEVIAPFNYQKCAIKEGDGAFPCEKLGRHYRNYLLCREEVWGDLEPLVGLRGAAER